jgi:uncharacterized metal-binding protein
MDHKASTPASIHGNLPLVYSCSGCPNAAQLANTLAVMLDREGYAEMSCIAGIGGNIKSILDKATSGRPIVALDGCALNCAKNCLQRHGIEPLLHMDLSEYGIRHQRYHENAPAPMTERMWKNLILQAIRNLTEYGAVGGKADM